MQWTLRQVCAFDVNRNWVVSTGAGAGKTSVLTHRYLHLLREFPNLKAREILALTFTQKAQEEMRGRIYRELNRVIYGEGEDPLAARYRQVKEEFFENRILTFHAFCLRILRMYPVEADVDSSLRILEDVDQRQIALEVFEEVMLRYIRKSSRPDGSAATRRNQVFLELLECLDLKQLRKASLEFLRKPRLWQDFADTLDRLEKDPQAWFTRLVKERAGAVFEMLRETNLSPLIKEQRVLLGDTSSAYATLLAEIETHLSDLKGWEDVVALREPVRRWLASEVLANPARLHGATLTPAKLRDRLLESGIQDLEADLDRRAWAYLRCFHEFFTEVARAYEKRLSVDQVLDFDRVQNKTLELLRKRSEITRGLREKIKFILVDEFQDTDPVQWEILRLLMENAASTPKDAGRLFVVGDEKQAIYGFRGGDCRIFEKARQWIIARNAPDIPFSFEKEPNTAMDRSYATQLEQLMQDSLAEVEAIRQGDLRFNENFRSNATLIQFFNRFFEKLFRPEEGHDPRPQELVAVKPAKGSTGLPIQILAIPTSEASEENEEEDLDDALKEAKMIADLIHNIRHGQNNYRDIREGLEQKIPTLGILFRRFTKLKIYEEVFRQQGIDFFVHRGKGFFRRQEILDLYNLLEFLHDPRRDIHLVGVLRSSLMGCRDEEIIEVSQEKEETTLYRKLALSPKERHQEIFRQLVTWVQLKDRLRISELLRRILGDLSARALFGIGIRGRQTLQNVEKLLEMARDFERNGFRGLAGFCEVLRDQIDEDEQEGEAILDPGSSSGVVVMTVHQAKGLQFPMVVLPDLNARFNLTMDHLVETLWEPHETFWGLKCPNPKNGFARDDTLARTMLKSKVRAKQIAEEKRLLYVAMTRAMECLVLVGRARSEEAKAKGKRHGSEVTTAWQWLEEILNIYEGMKEVRVSDDAEPIAVRWYQKGDALLRPWVPRLPPAPSSEEIKQLKDRYVFHLEPIVYSREIHISPSHLSLFDQCQRKYYFEVVLGMRQEDFSVSTGIVDNHSSMLRAGLRGKVIHRLLEIFAEEDLKAATASFLQAAIWDLPVAARNLCQGKWRQELESEIVQEVSTFFADRPLARLLRDLKKEDPARILSEVRFDLAFGSVHLRGVIDKMVQEKKGGRWRIIDFKTGAASEESFDLQLNCYALAAEEILGSGRVEGLEIYFTRGKGEIKRIPLALAETRQKLYDLGELFGKEEMDLHQLSPPRKDSICQACAFSLYGICDYPKSKVTRMDTVSH